MKHLIWVASLISIGVYAEKRQACAAQPVLDRCLETTKALAKECGETDYDCLCATYKSIAICYDNCPKDGGITKAKEEAKEQCATAAASASSAIASKPTSSTSGQDLSSSPSAKNTSETKTTSNSVALATATRQPTTSATETSTGAAQAHSWSVRGVLVAAGLAVALV